MEKLALKVRYQPRNNNNKMYSTTVCDCWWHSKQRCLNAINAGSPLKSRVKLWS